MYIKKKLGFLALIMGLTAFSMDRWDYECEQRLYLVISYDSSGSIIGSYTTSITECGWVFYEDVSDGSNTGGGGGGTNPSPSTPSTCQEKSKTVLFREHSKATTQPAAIIATGDFDGNGLIEEHEEVDLLAFGLDAEFFMNAVIGSHHKSIRIKTGPHRGGILIYDENDNQVPDSAREFFSNRFTLEGLPTQNASVALLEGDRLENGGNEDGQIDAADSFWERLFVWIDANQDHQPERHELHSLSDLGITAIDPFLRRLPPERNLFGYQIELIRENGARYKAELL